MLFWILVVLTGLLALASLVSTIRHEAWWIRVLDFPRLQLSGLALLLLVLQLGLLEHGRASTWGLVALTIMALIHQARWILPYMPFYPREVKAARDSDIGDRLRLLTVNVLTPNRQSAKLLAMIQAHRPDVLVALETDRWWQEQLDSLEPDYPYAVKCPLDNLYGMLVYSRLPLHDAKIQYLVESTVPSIHAQVELPSKRLIALHAIHPAPPSPTENLQSLERDAELVVLGKAVAGADQPVVVTGDLNDVAWSATSLLFRKLSGLLDPRVGRGMFNTFHAQYWFLRWPLDHVFHSDDFTLVRMQRLGRFGSDHFPILVELALQPRRGADQETPKTDADDRQLGREKAGAKDVEKSDVHRPGD